MIVIKVSEIEEAAGWPASWSAWLGAPVQVGRLEHEVEIRLVGVPAPHRRFASARSALEWVQARVHKFLATAEELGGEETASGRYYRDHAYRLGAVAWAIHRHAARLWPEASC
jgi:hypothetical protein